jgi:hypothetical protein
MTHQESNRASGSWALLLAGAVLLSACAQTQLVDSWQAEEKITHKPDKVAVVAVLPDALIRESVEIDVAKLLVRKGTPAVASSRLPGMSGGIRGEIDSEAATGLLRQAGVDGVIVIFYAGGADSEGYVRSDYWTEYVGSGVGYGGYGWGRPYFVDVYTVNQGPGYADYQRSALIESSYYDMESKQPVWRIVTQTKDVEHADTALDVAGKIASEMRSAGLN